MKSYSLNAGCLGAGPVLTEDAFSVLQRAFFSENCRRDPVNFQKKQNTDRISIPYKTEIRD